MAAEEFILIPRSMYLREQPEVTQILQDPNIGHKPLQLQRDQSRTARNDEKTQPEVSANTTEVQEQLKEDKILDELKTLPAAKLKRVKSILDKIKLSKTVSVDENENLTMNGVQIELGVAEFLYNLQQPTKKLDTSLYETILTELKIGSHLLLNKYAKQIIEEARAQTSTSRFVGGTPKKTSKKKKTKNQTKFW